MNFCKECGAKVSTKAEICPTCGCRLKGVPEAITEVLNGRNRLVAILLALFLGSLGIHKFYLGSLGWGIAYILFSWTGIPAIAGFVEAVLLLVMDEETFTSKYQ